MSIIHRLRKEGQSIPDVHSFPKNGQKLLGWPTTDKAGIAPDSFCPQFSIVFISQ